MMLISSILELNRFRYFDDLSEAEGALQEIIELNWETIAARYVLAIVSARQKQFAEARDYFIQGENELSEMGESPVFEDIRKINEFELAFAEERWEEAVLAYQKSIEIEQSSGYRWDCARRLIDLGDALIGRNEQGDLKRARETYQQSLDMFTEMGAPGYIKVLEGRLGDL